MYTAEGQHSREMSRSDETLPQTPVQQLQEFLILFGILRVVQRADETSLDASL